MHTDFYSLQKQQNAAFTLKGLKIKSEAKHDFASNHPNMLGTIFKASNRILVGLNTKPNTLLYLRTSCFWLSLVFNRFLNFTLEFSFIFPYKMDSFLMLLVILLCLFFFFFFAPWHLTILVIKKKKKNLFNSLF